MQLLYLDVKNMNKKLYLIKIRLVDAKPEIWRRFVVPSDIPLDRLHDIIQIVMGWTDSHIHEFIIAKKKYTEYPESVKDGLPCGKYRLGDLVKRKGSIIKYIYDFGDSWEHELCIEDSGFEDQNLPSPVFCLGGARCCPPEDVGGVPGYTEFCKAMNDPFHIERNSCIEWYGGDFDSECFEPIEVNWELIKYLRWSRERSLSWEPE